MRQVIKCPKCSGHGTIGTLAHIAGGTCFMCHGSGKVLAEPTLAELEAEAIEEAGFDPFGDETVDEFKARQKAEAEDETAREWAWDELLAGLDREPESPEWMEDVA